MTKGTESLERDRRIEETDFHSIPAILLKWDGYEVLVLPDRGANAVSFIDKKRDFHFLHTPTKAQLDDFTEHPYLYGIPVLFPPNRYDDGKFEWNGRTYQLPINEPENSTHLHGFLHSAPWTVTDQGVLADEAFLTLTHQVDSGHPLFKVWPHEFTVRIRYSLSADGLVQHISIKNTGRDSMPCLIGLHTAINAPFAPNSQASDYTFKVTIGERWELNERGLPTGRLSALGANEDMLKSTGVYPFAEMMDNHYTAVPQNGHNRMELSDRRNGVTLVYDVGTTFRQWMIWNNFARPGFFCPEPQLNLVNAPNVNLPREQMALFALEQGEIWETSTRLFCRDN